MRLVGMPADQVVGMRPPEVRIHQANVPATVRPEDQARLATSLDRFAAYLKTGVS